MATMNEKKHNDYSRIMANYALIQAQEYYKNLGSKINIQAKRVPTLIRFNGLAPTFAFYYSKHKKNNEYEAILKIAYEWLNKHSIYKQYFNTNPDNKFEFYKSFTEIHSSEYRAISNELIQLFNWLRRFTNALTQNQSTD